MWQNKQLWFSAKNMEQHGNTFTGQISLESQDESPPIMFEMMDALWDRTGAELSARTDLEWSVYMAPALRAWRSNVQAMIANDLKKPNGAPLMQSDFPPHLVFPTMHEHPFILHAIAFHHFHLAQRTINYLEVGAFRGATTLLMARSGIPGTPVNITAVDLMYYPGQEDEFRANVNALAPAVDQVTLIRSTSAEGHALLGGLMADIVFIDGDHSYVSAKLDFKLYASRVAPGGFLVADDYGYKSGCPGVRIAMQEFIKEAGAGEWCNIGTVSNLVGAQCCDYRDVYQTRDDVYSRPPPLQNSYVLRRGKCA
jgi:hypothetical protein